MSSAQFAPSRLVPGRFPPPGSSPIADRIRQRRGARGLTPLDGTLLHVPPIAEGWNSLLGAVRTGGSLPGDVRELMILRVAAINDAAFEWIQHEPVGRTHGLTTAQLYIVRDTTTPLPPSVGILTSLQTSALLFADASTRDVRVPARITDQLTKDLADWARTQEAKEGDTRTEKEVVEDLLVEAAAVVATYNMVSRFLVSLDIAGLADDPVPWPLDRQEHSIPLPSGSTMHAITLTSSPTAPWIAFTNSLLTDLTMWGPLIPFLLSTSHAYNILLHSQHGHGQSTSAGSTTIPSLAADLAHALAHLAIPLPLHSVIGVSQGGAAALAFATLVSAAGEPLTRSVVACDTAPRTPAGNREAWEARIGVVYGRADSDSEAHAEKVGMGKLAEMTVARWFPPGSRCFPGDAVTGEGAGGRRERGEWVAGMIAHTRPQGFVAGARALSAYDLLVEGGGLMGSRVPRVLLVAGELDGGGAVGRGLRGLREAWNGDRVRAGGEGVEEVRYVEIAGAGHLPMVDETEAFWEVLGGFLGEH